MEVGGTDGEKNRRCARIMFTRARGTQEVAATGKSEIEVLEDRGEGWGGEGGGSVTD